MPMVGEELFGIVDNVACTLNIKLESQMLHKLGPYKEFYLSWVSA